MSINKTIQDRLKAKVKLTTQQSMSQVQIIQMWTQLSRN